MASSMLSNAAIAATAGAQARMVAPFNGLKSFVAFPVTKKSSKDFSSLPTNGGRVQCMQVWTMVMTWEEV